MKNLQEEYQQLVPLPFTSQRTGGVPLKQGQKAYFDDISLLRGNRITSIAFVGLATGDFNGLLPAGDYGARITLTMIDKNNDVLLWRYPLSDLLDFTYSSAVADTRGKIRLFDLQNVSFKKSYVTNTNSTAISTGLVLLFNFFSQD